MWFGYSPQVIEQYPEIAAAVIWVDSFADTGSSAKIEQLLSESEALTRDRCLERAAIAQQAPITAWRSVYSRMGLKPNRYPCATEQLMRRVVDGHPLPRIAGLVDLGNAAALKYMIPVAPFGLDRVQGFCEVRHAAGNERFWAINAGAPEPIPEGEVIFADDSHDVISRRWAWRQSDKGKVTLDTRQVVIVAEAVHADAVDTVRQAGAFLAEHLRDLLGANLRFDVLTSERPRSERESG